MSNFNRVRNLVPGRSVFDLSYSKLFTGDMGNLYPVMHDEVVPGDIFEIAAETVIRFQPMVAPMLHEVNVFTHYFFVPYRLLWDDWEKFITGDFDGQDESVLPRVSDEDADDWSVKGTLWDYFGFPIQTGTENPTQGRNPLQFPWLAYRRIVKEFYADENLDNLDAFDTIGNDISRRRWEKDYFTSALPWQQRGTAPALPISGTTSAVWDSSTFVHDSGGYALNTGGLAGNPYIYVDNPVGRTNLENAFNDNEVDLSLAATFDVSDLRLAFQIQKWMERNARAGVRYTEFLKSHFGIAPRDDRLDRPEYIGGTKSPVVVSEVLQTSETDTTPQGNLAGHGISIGSSYVGKYRVKEYGIIMGMLSVMPKPVYCQGVNRQWLRESRYDYYFPEFANLSEQEIFQMELFCNGDSEDNLGIFGYQGRYDEMRVKQNLVCGDMRDDFDYWHLARIFETSPALNRIFMQCNPSKRIFAATEEDGLIIHHGNKIKAIRPLPKIAEPGLIDH